MLKRSQVSYHGKLAMVGTTTNEEYDIRVVIKSTWRIMGLSK